MFLNHWLQQLSSRQRKVRNSKSRRHTQERMPATTAQVLEPRELLTVAAIVEPVTKTLVITGTAAADNVQVYDTISFQRLSNGDVTDTQYDVTIVEGTSTRTFSRSSVQRVVFRGNGGDDSFQRPASFRDAVTERTYRLTLPTLLDGGDGNDTL